MDRLEVFRSYLTDYSGQKESTIAMYCLIMGNIVGEVVDFTKGNIENYILSLVRLKRQKSTIKAHISLIHWWGKCFKISAAKHYTFEGKLRLKQYDRAVFSEAEQKAFLSIPNPFPKTSRFWIRHEMWTCFWTICTYQACRPGEAIRLRKFPCEDNKSHADFGLNTITFDQKVGMRKMPLAVPVREILLSYLPLVEGDHLFPPMHASNLPYMKCNSWGEDFSKRLNYMEVKFPGITKRENLDPYSVRTSGATRWAKQRKNMKVIQDLMGHKRITTTEKYIKLDLDTLTQELNSDTLADDFLLPQDALTCIENTNRDLKIRFLKQLDAFFVVEPGRLAIEFKIKK